MMIHISQITPTSLEKEIKKISTKLSERDSLTLNQLIQEILPKGGFVSIDWIINNYFHSSKDGYGYYRNFISRVWKAIDESNSKMRVYTQNKSLINPAKITFFIEYI